MKIIFFSTRRLGFRSLHMNSCVLVFTLLKIVTLVIGITALSYAHSQPVSIKNEELFALPTNIRVINPSTDISANIAAFSGAWIGDWETYGAAGGSSVRHMLIVEEVQAQDFKAIYAVASGQGRDRPTLANWARVSGSISDGILSFKPSSGALVSYKVSGPDELQGTLISGQTTLSAKVNRTPLPIVNIFQLVPLPNDVRIEAVSDEKSDVFKRMLGVWVGWWGGTVPHILVVEKFGEKGVEVVYASGTTIPPGTSKTFWRRIVGEMDGDQLVLRLNSNATTSYKLSDDGSLTGSIKTQSSGSTTGVLHKSSLP